ncbi:MAG: hypothetical protein DWQ04_23150 [Chloroflexi bacterium]|nr:MAG: hypothetical protein DWQ04_23150 [Chloroflexota bacterium]
MIVFVDNEHEQGYAASFGEMILAARTRIKYRLEDITGQPCLIVRYTHITTELLQQYDVQAIFVSGSGTDSDLYSSAEQANFHKVILEKAWPMFAFCGGFQVMAEAFGAPLAPIGPLPPDTPDPHPNFAPGRQKEMGYFPVNITKSHPLLEGLGEQPIMRHAHSWEMKAIPKEFTNYASTDITPVQLLIHDGLPIMGTQFHPEYYTDEHPAGRVLIENFCKMVGLI